MADREVANLIFMPGFSTAAKVTNVSGRGVGMDVVNTKYLDRPIFAGTSASTVAYDANGSFVGDTNAVNRSVGPGVTVQVNVTGPQAFGPPGADLFSTLASLSNDLRNNPGAINTTDLGAIDTAASRVRNALGEVGARSAQLTTTKTRSDDLLLNLRDSLSKIEDIDLPKVATDLQIQQVSYQAALAATARVIQPSLVDFLK
jgi:flagellar hook-associated protein 3 FlgL